VAQAMTTRTNKNGANLITHAGWGKRKDLTRYGEQFVSLNSEERPEDTKEEVKKHTGTEH